MATERKRAASVISHLPEDSINPYSYSENTLKQLRVAGLSPEDLLPSAYIPGFPHRSLDSMREGEDSRAYRTAGTVSSGDESGWESAGRAKQSRRPPTAPGRAGDVTSALAA